MLLLVALVLGIFFGSWISTVCGTDGTKEVWNVPFVIGLSNCWVGKGDSGYLLLDSNLLQSVLEVTYGSEGIKFVIFKFSTFSLDFEMDFCFDVFIADECFGIVVIIGIVICSCDLLLDDSEILFCLSLLDNFVVMVSNAGRLV